MSEKEKPKRSPRMGFLRSCLIFSLYPLLILIVCGFLYGMNGGLVKPWLDTQYIPTAEYLLENPIEIRTRQTAQSSDWLYAELKGDFDDGVCLIVSGENGSDVDNLQWAEVYINEHLVKNFNPFMDVFDSLPWFTYLCFTGYLNRGLHIIEFRAKQSASAEPYYIRRWAVEIP